MHSIETTRLYLRPLSVDDLDDFALMGSDAEVMRFIGSGITLSKDQTAKRLYSMVEHWSKHGFGLWAAIERVSNAWMGFCGLQLLDNTQEIEVGYRLAKQFWGSGFATEGARASVRYGFEQLELNKIVAVVQPENFASQRVLEKSGLKYLREDHFYNSRVKYFAITRDEYEPDDSTYIQKSE